MALAAGTASAEYNPLKLGYAAAEYIGSVYQLDALARSRCSYLFPAREDPEWVLDRVKRNIPPDNHAEIYQMARGPKMKAIVMEAERIIDDTLAKGQARGMDRQSTCSRLYGSLMQFHKDKEGLWHFAVKNYSK